MFYKDLRVWVPDEEILGVKFFKHENFSVKQLNGKPYIVAAEIVKTGNFIGFGSDGMIYLLDFDNNKASYAASALAVFARELKQYRDFPKVSPSENAEEVHERVKKFAEEIKKLDKNAFSNEENFWSSIIEQMNDVSL